MATGQSQLDPATPRGYSPKNVGNDASARPWERNTGSFDAAQLQPTGGSRTNPEKCDISRRRVMSPPNGFFGLNSGKYFCT